MNIVFCIYDFVAAKLPLQPWLSIRRVAEGLARRGHRVHVMSDVEEPAVIAGVESHSVVSLRGSNVDEIKRLLASLRPDALVFLPTPLNITTASWLDGVACRKVGFASYPYYNFEELMTAARSIGWTDTKQYLRHLLVPGPLWARAMRRRHDALIAQSLTTTRRLNALLDGAPECIHVPPGIDLAQWPLHVRGADQSSSAIRLLYLGAAIPIRGFDVALDALTLVKNEQVKMRVLARGADADALTAIQACVSRRGLAGRVEVEGGWIEREQLIEEIAAADAVLQPFVLVPSELPVTAMEVIACGTPVIGSRIDGLPSTINAAGTVVRQASAPALAEAISVMADSASQRSAWRAACAHQRSEMQDWDSVTDRWEVVLRG